METDTLKAGFPVLNVIWSQGSPHSLFDLSALILNMKQSKSWVKGELKNTILLDSPDKQVLLTALHENTEIDSFQESDSASFQILEGELMFSTMKESVILKKGQLLTLCEKVKYRLKTNAETVLLLTILHDTMKVAEN